MTDLPARHVAPWHAHGLRCPNGIPYHQPHPSPWWSGDSVFRGLFTTAAPTPPPPGTRFYHVVYTPTPATAQLRAGDLLTSPATRRSLPPRLSVADDGCIHCVYYDVHAVYFSLQKPVASSRTVFKVEPIGEVWPDPELQQPWDWCAKSARIVAVL